MFARVREGVRSSYSVFTPLRVRFVEEFPRMF